MIISKPKKRDTASIEEVLKIDEAELITPSPALTNFLTLADPAYDGGKVCYSYACSELSRHILQNHNHIKTERVKILKLYQYKPLYNLFRINFPHHCLINLFFRQHIHFGNLSSKQLVIRNGESIKLTITQKEAKPAVVKDAERNLEVIQLKEELLMNQHHLEHALMELKQRDERICRLLSKPMTSTDCGWTSSGDDTDDNKESPPQ